MDFNGFLVIDPAGNVAIDPPELEPTELDRIWELGGVAHVVLPLTRQGRLQVAPPSARCWAKPALLQPRLLFFVDQIFRVRPAPR